MLEHVEPQVFVRGAENPQLLEDLAGKLYRSKSARSDNAPVIHRRDRLIERRSAIPRNVFGYIARHVAGVPPIVEHTRASNRKCSPADCRFAR